MRTSPPSGLLVSVRSAEEARQAILGGASVIDVKEPDRGPLGCADPDVWQAVREAVPMGVLVSVALGELRDWIGRTPPAPGAFDGIAFRKLGLSGLAGSDWAGTWANFRRASGPGPSWVAVAYLDDDLAGSPTPDEVRNLAIDLPECAGLLLDTWHKSGPADFRAFLPDWFEPIRRSGRFVALAGGLDADAIARLSPLRPDLFAVRGSACGRGDRVGSVDRNRVRELAEAGRKARATVE